MSVGEIVAYLVGGFFVLVGTVATAFYGYRASKVSAVAANRIEAIRVDGEAYDRAQRINGDIVEELRAEISRLSDEIRALRTQLDEESKRSMQMVRLLTQHNIPWPSGA